MSTNMRLSSPAFEAGETIPAQYTCEGADISPPLEWQGVPQEAQSLALVCDDPDAPGGTWSHWVLYNLPTDRDLLEEDIPTDETLDWGAAQGRNDFGNIGYGGPCPPRGHGPHRYFFRLYALDKALDLGPGMTREQVLNAIQPHMIGSAEYMGRYSR